MDNLGILFSLVYEKHFKKHIDKNNNIHVDIENLLLGKKVKNKGFEYVVKLLSQNAELEITDKVLENLKNGILDDIYFKENKLAVNQDSINEVTKLRKIDEVVLNENPLTNPFRQVVMTSNIMLTLPKDYNSFKFNNKHHIDMDEQQENWYDHPIPLDIRDESNEIIYGLVNLSKSIKYETDEKVAVILSVSVTHKSLNQIAKEYIISKLSDKDISNLDIYIFTEDECNLLTSILDEDDKDLQDTLGVSGRYGRHYSFLKAIIPLYKQVVDENVCATFKIDLDQVFPQEELKEITGKYAFDNFKSKRWGASGIDRNGRKVRLSMAAGGLVNENDIDDYLFTPDVRKNDDAINLEQLFFNSARPQYISTVGEICKQYDKDDECISRYHVTGGVNGILLDDLMKFRPFVPSFFTRAEDQGYLLSVIDKEVDGEYLRCGHLDRFVMRHDKEAFLSEDLKIFEIPKSVGDFERVLIYSHYSYDILCCGDYIKDETYPFTGCFVLKRPYTSVLLRAFAKLLMMNEDDGRIFLESFIVRITTLVKSINNNELKDIYIKEKCAFDRYYDMLLEGMDERKSEALLKVFKQAKIG